MCNICNDIQLSEYFQNPNEYMDCLCYIQKLIESNNFKIISGTCPINKIKDENGFWVNDIIEHKIRCKKCNQQFLCNVDTYHGGGRFRKV